MKKIDYQKRVLVVHTHSMCQVASVLSQLSIERELGILAG